MSHAITPRTYIVFVFFSPSNEDIEHAKLLSTHYYGVVVDNSDHPSCDVNTFGKLKYISNNKNLGIAEAQNIGISEALRHEDTQYSVFLDQDSRLDIDYPEKIVEEFESIQKTHNQLALLGPTIINKDNEIQGYMDSINKKPSKSKRDVLTLKQLGRERLQMLAEIKSDFVKQLLKYLKNYRTLTFCYDIKQTKELGKYCINSQNKRAAEYLDMFNQKKIKHITACNQLNEGVNLTDCKYGIFVNYNVSEICYLQKQGKLYLPLCF